MTAQSSAIDLDAVGASSPPTRFSWCSRDALLYALGVGAGMEDPLAELEFTTETSLGINQRVLPTFAVLWHGPIPHFGTVDRAKLVHADQALTVYGPVPTSGEAIATTTLTGIYDKGSGALIRTRTKVIDAQSGESIAESESGAFARGAGGFGGERGPSSVWARPSRPPDVERRYRTNPAQALLYRLSGDRNPLHSDPQVARQGGFSRPILHGLCTYGFAGRALLADACGGDVARWGSISARFSHPVLPGQALTIALWREPPLWLFQVRTESERIVLDQGVFTTRAEGEFG